MLAPGPGQASTSAGHARLCAGGKGPLMPRVTLLWFHVNDGNTVSLKSVGQATRHGTFTLWQSSLRHGSLSSQRLNMACSYPRIPYLWIFLRLQRQKHTDISVKKTMPPFGHTGCLLSRSGSRRGAFIVPRTRFHFVGLLKWLFYLCG